MPPIVDLLVRLLPFAALVLPLARADPPPFTAQEADDYDKGGFGLYPEIKYKTSELVSAHILHRKWEPQCNKSPGYVFFAPRGMLVGHPGPMIMDNNGQMIWHDEAFPVTYGLTVQEYRKEKYITFWSGNDQVIGHGSGSYYMFDKHYQQYKKVDPVNINSTNVQMTGDLHEFKITEDNTALLTSYISLPWDLSAYGRKEASWVWECIFQEIDIETNELLFQWNAMDHFTFDDCYNPLRGAGAANNPWDWFHINSVEKDKHGNYIMSSRYSHTVTYINGKTGDTMWHLGGKNNSFTDLSDGRATDFCWQHDARWSDNYKSISMFDNHAYFADQNVGARGVKIAVDQKAMTAEVIAEAIHPRGYISESQGSCQILPNGNFFLGYGSAAAFAEYSPGGELLCDMQYGALHYHKDGSFSPSAVMSYRIYKHEWEGHPVENPKVLFADGVMYVSWNGATELASWVLDGTNRLGNNERDWDMAGHAFRSGFESNISVEESAYSLFRLTALDKSQKKLGMWVVYSAGEVKAIPMPQASRSSSLVYILFGAFLTFVTITIFSRKVELRSHLASIFHAYTPSGVLIPGWATKPTPHYEDVERVGLTKDMGEKEY